MNYECFALLGNSSVFARAMWENYGTQSTKIKVMTSEEILGEIPKGVAGAAEIKFRLPLNKNKNLPEIQLVGSSDEIASTRKELESKLNSSLIKVGFSQWA